MGRGNRNKGHRPKPKAQKATTVNMGSKRRLSRMGKQQKKEHSGEVAQYMSRAKALKTLQITLRDFRRLCILKGIYPRDPKKKPNKDKNKTYYHVKDISYLAHEPLLDKFRSFKAFMKKVRRRLAKKNHRDANRMYDNKPEYSLDHLVRERYPQFKDSLEDLDDGLCLVHLFAALPSIGAIRAERTENCLKLCKEWQLYIVKSRALRKVFCSVKGMYYQAEVQGVIVTWLVPHKFTQNLPNEVDYRVMLTFLEFYETLLGFVMFKLYHKQGLRYPPKIIDQKEKDGAHLESLSVDTTVPHNGMEENVNKIHDTVASATSNQEGQNQVNTTEQKKSYKSELDKATKERLNSLPAKLKSIPRGTDHVEANSTKEISEDAEDAVFAQDESKISIMENKLRTDVVRSLFSGLKFWISREVPYESMQLCILALDGEVMNQSVEPNNAIITHFITDRHLVESEVIPTREYVQPQWVFDSINFQMLLPVSRYHPNSKDLPPHLSPFVDDKTESYKPRYAEELDKLKAARNSIKYDTRLIPDVKGNSLERTQREEEKDLDDSPGSELEEEEKAKAEPHAVSNLRKQDKSDEREEKEENEDTNIPQKEIENITHRKFITSKKFKGRKEGYVYRLGDLGVGYYQDTNRDRKITFMKVKTMSKRAQRKVQKRESHERGRMMMTKKARRLYDRMHHGINKKMEEVNELKKKRIKLDRKIGRTSG